ncbi:hypothetical protein BJS_00485 [Bradyrhizobium japonicum SEMIA 5079]|nr:hypothetical protein BJS_00485 [Bradyrhizobium japonicum SEMIA 5079]
MGADTRRFPRPDAMVDRANAQHRMPTIILAAQLPGRKFKGSRRYGHLIERWRRYCDWNDCRKNLGRPIDGLFPE